MRDELQRATLLLRREVLEEGLPRRGAKRAARMLPREPPRAIVKAELEQHGLLDLRDALRSVDPNPLADDLREGPLTGDTALDEGEHPGLLHGPMLLMERPAELPGREREGPTLRHPRAGDRLSGGHGDTGTRRRGAGRLTGLSRRRPRAGDGRLGLRLTYWCIFLFHMFFKIHKHKPATKPKGRSLEVVFPVKVDRSRRRIAGALARTARRTLTGKATSI